MSDRRHFLATVAGGCGAILACSPGNEKTDELVEALRALNDAAGIGIAPDEFEAARDYAAGAYREARLKLRPIVLDESMDLPLAFAAKRGRS
jgi:hypothetical protein